MELCRDRRGWRRIRLRDLSWKWLGSDPGPRRRREFHLGLRDVHGRPQHRSRGIYHDVQWQSVQADITVYQVQPDGSTTFSLPNLPPLPIAATQPSVGSSMAMIRFGDGNNRTNVETWGLNTVTVDISTISPPRLTASSVAILKPFMAPRTIITWFSGIREAETSFTIPRAPNGNWSA